MKRNRITAQKTWIRIDNQFHLFVSIGNHVYTSRFEVVSLNYHNAIKTNKALKELSMIDKIKRELHVRKVELI